MRRVLVMLLCWLSIAAAGCAAAPSTPEGADVPSEFERLVTEAERAFEAGDALSAFDLYREALDQADAGDADGSITARRDQAKAVYVARSLLAKDANPMDPSESISIVVQYSLAETETAAAKGRIVDFLQGQADAMRRDIPELQATIKAEREYKLPLSIYMVGEMGETWGKALGQLEGEFGSDAVSALRLLQRAAQEASAVMERKWIEDGVKDLQNASTTLDELNSALEELRKKL